MYLEFISTFNKTPGIKRKKNNNRYIFDSLTLFAFIKKIGTTNKNRKANRKASLISKENKKIFIVSPFYYIYYGQFL